MLPLFAIPIFLASFLLFFLEPMVGKLLLPTFGGTPAIWNTCLVFFQVALLTGYALSAVLIRVSSPLYQTILIVILLSSSFLFDQFTSFDIHSVNSDGEPVWVIANWLLLTIGLPFVTISTLPSAIQSWFVNATDRKLAPYKLYAASNAGSLIGLLAYPFVFERALGLKAQIEIWKSLYLVLILSVALIGIFSWWRYRKLSKNISSSVDEAPSPSFIDYTRWVALAALPSALLLGVTTFLLTDLISLPLLWVVPLVLYLVTYIVAFGRNNNLWTESLYIPATFLGILAVVCFFLDLSTPIWFLVTVHLSLFLLLAMLCHSRVARSAPPPKFLGNFYVALAFGGAVGGISIQLLAPMIFSRALEYPLTIAFILLSLAGISRIRSELINFRIYLVPLFLIIGVAFGGTINPVASFAVGYGIAAIMLYSLSRKPGAFALGFLGLVFAASFIPSPLGRTLDVRRSFFGITRTVVSDEGRAHAVVHGSTVHGVQMINTRDTCTPTSYFHSTSPVGKLLEGLAPNKQERRIAVLGLGVGSLICYAKGNDYWSLIEINPDMEAVANEERLFTFMKNSPTSNYKIVIGDGRLKLSAEPGKFDGIFLDAFTSDAVPIHLLTEEGVATYIDKLEERGLLVFQVSSRYFDLAPFIRAAGRENNLTAWVANDFEVTPEQGLEGKRASQWVVLTRDEESRELLEGAGFNLVQHDDLRPWTDDKSNPLDALM